MNDLMREYEARRFPAYRRLDLQGEGPRSARERALHWLQSRAHESPGEEVLLIVERGGRPGRPPSPMAVEVQKLLAELDGKLIEWWQPFAPGSYAVRISSDPRIHGGYLPPAQPVGDGRTAETAGAARPRADRDIPPELLDTARQIVYLRLEREGLTNRISDVLLREVWIEVQATAMEERMTFEAAMSALLEEERQRHWED